MFGRKSKVGRLTVTVRAVTRDGLCEAVARICEAFDGGEAGDAARALLYEGVSIGACLMADEVANGPTGDDELARLRADADEVAHMTLAARGVTL